METSLLTPSNIMFVLGLLAIMFSIFRYFREPQEKAEKTDALMDQQMRWTSDATENRFKSMQESFNSLLLQSNNHIHTVETKVDRLHEGMGVLGQEVVKLATIIDERIPKK